eukprot:1145059-Pelagomonas_calceolata.AAC.1
MLLANASQLGPRLQQPSHASQEGLLHLQNPVAVFKTVHAARSRESLARANRRPVHTQMAKKPDVVPASELPKPHPKALKALEKLRLQVLIYRCEFTRASVIQSIDGHRCRTGSGSAALQTDAALSLVLCRMQTLELF